MRDTGNQVTLGTFIATFAYCLLVLRSVTEPSGADVTGHVPHFSLLVAMLLTLLSVANLIYFIHHIPESINVGNLAHKLAKDMLMQIKSEFPTYAESKEQAPSNLAAVPQDYEAMRLEGHVVRTKTAGCIQVVDVAALVQAATDKDIILLMACRPGDFVNQGSILLYAWPGKHITESDLGHLADQIIVGEKRTSDQDFLFLVDQLVEIILRALSPGVNDAFTAVSCLDWSQSILLMVLSRSPESGERFDDQKELRVVIPTVSFQRLTDAFFLQPLQHVAANRVVALHTMEVFDVLLAASLKEAHTNTLLKHAELLHNAGLRLLSLKSDQDDLHNLYVEMIARVNSQTST